MKIDLHFRLLTLHWSFCCAEVACSSYFLDIRVLNSKKKSKEILSSVLGIIVPHNLSMQHIMWALTKQTDLLHPAGTSMDSDKSDSIKSFDYGFIMVVHENF